MDVVMDSDSVDGPRPPMGHPTTPAIAPRRMIKAVETDCGAVGLVMTRSFFFWGEDEDEDEDDLGFILLIVCFFFKRIMRG